ncbi:MAG: hypothetical protein AUI14_07375 [Actinobacteria bacterium 13_2_20CM_2_71_6]|nr:MAG: hypothetical protein AUI14_07375 [Actinobacteria bacterium 13_2_20CM_2_71_6]
MTGLTRLRLLFVALLLVGTAALAIGMGVEDAERHSAAVEASQHTESTESTGHSESGGTEPAAGHFEAGEARILGINVEGPAFIAGAVLASLLVAAAVWWRPRRVVLLVAAGFCVAATALDIREVAHQASSDHAGLATIAVLVAVLHAGAAFAAAVAARVGQVRPSPG